MKKIVFILSILISALATNAQLFRVNGFPGWDVDAIHIRKRFDPPRGDPSLFSPTFFGIMINSATNKLLVSNGTVWNEVGSAETDPLSIHITDSAAMLTPYFRTAGFGLISSGHSVSFDSSVGFHTQDYYDLRYQNTASPSGRFGIEDNVGIQNRLIRHKAFNFKQTVGDDSSFVGYEAEFGLNSSGGNGFSVYTQDNGYNNQSSLHIFPTASNMAYFSNINPNVSNTVSVKPAGAILSSYYNGDEANITTDSGRAYVKNITGASSGKIKFPFFTGDLTKYSALSVNGNLADINGNVTVSAATETDPLYTANGVPKTRTLTINGTAQDLTDDRSWTIATGSTETASNGLTKTVNDIQLGGALTQSTTITNSSFPLIISNDVSINGLTVGKGAGNVADNTVLGVGGLASNTTGLNSTAVGYQALNAATNTTAKNTAVGYQSMALGAAGSYNAAFGYKALRNNSAAFNTAIGATAMSGASNGIITGDHNTAVGYAALNILASGVENTGIGYVAMGGVTGNGTGSYNTALGSAALKSNVGAGGYNTGAGHSAGFSSTGNNNIFLGYKAGNYQTTGDNKFFVNSIDRTTLASDTTLSLLYGIQDAVMGNQWLRVNGNMRLGNYGAGTHLGARTYPLAVTSNGYIVEDTTSYGGGGGAETDPLYTANGVPKTRTLTINGTAFDLSANRSWTTAGITSVDKGYGILQDGTITTTGTITADTTKLASRTYVINNYAPVYTPNLYSSFESGAWIGHIEPSASYKQYHDIAWSPELHMFAAVSPSGVFITYSYDGQTWTNASTPGSFYNWTSICWASGLGKFFAIGSFDGSQARVLSSSDGINWTESGGVDSKYWSSICYSPELNTLVTVGNGGYSYSADYSTNGTTWTSTVTSTINNANGVCWSKDLALFVAVGGGSTALTSPTGATWTASTTIVSGTWRDVVYSPKLKLLVAVGDAGAIMTSPDGITWTSRSGGGSGNLYGIDWAPSLGEFAAVKHTISTNQSIITSRNGINWVTRTSASTNPWTSIAWSPELQLFAAVSSDQSSGTSTVFQTSTFSVGIAATGTATLAAGTVTVSTSAVLSGSKIFLTVNTPAGTQGFLSAPTASIVSGTSFVINSTSATETSTVNWLIVN